MSGQKNKLSIIIPCYNEKETLSACLSRVQAIAEGQDFELEIIIVDDASCQECKTKLKEISAAQPDIKILTHEVNRGKGAAVRTGLMHATGDFVAIQDADTEYNPQDYLPMLRTLLEKNADVVYGSRYLAGGTRRVLGFWHTMVNKFLTNFANMLTDMTLTDMETCYKLMRRDLVQKIAPTLKEERFGFEVELTAKIAQARAVVFEHPISYTPRSYEEGKKIGWKDGVSALRCIVRYNALSAPLPAKILFGIITLILLSFILCII